MRAISGNEPGRVTKEKKQLDLAKALRLTSEEGANADQPTISEKSSAATSTNLQSTHSSAPPSSQPFLFLMSSRFKNLVSRRKSNNPNPAKPCSVSPSPPQATEPSPPTDADSSSTLLPQAQQMNPNQPLGRPPSYTYTNAGQLGAPPQGGRPHSPMPPPINTATAQTGYPPQQIYGAPAAAAPPTYPQNPAGYGSYGVPGAAPAAYNRPGAAEVDGTGRGKAQLIVGIDFVCNCSVHMHRHGVANGCPRREPHSPASRSLSQPTTKPRKTSLPNGPARETKPSKKSVKIKACLTAAG